jgi:hypothetical protein
MNRLCPKCGKQKPSSRFRRRHMANVEGGPDVWCRSCERNHWDERVGSVELIRQLIKED